MRRLRLLISLAVALFLLWHGLEQFVIGETGLGGVFAAVWMTFAFLVIGGNLSALLHRRSQAKSVVFQGAAEKQKEYSERGRSRA